MPIRTLNMENPVRGLPRQPVPLRLAYLVTGLQFDDFLFLLAVRQEDRYEYLTGYEYAVNIDPREVRRDFYAALLDDVGPDTAESECIARLPADQFVWSDDLAFAFSQFIRDCPGEETARGDGMRLSWTPAWRGLDSLLEECVDLSALADATLLSTLSRRELGKQQTEERNERWRRACDELKLQHPDMTYSWIARKISGLPIAEGKDEKTIRKNMRRK